MGCVPDKINRSVTSSTWPEMCCHMERDDSIIPCEGMSHNLIISTWHGFNIYTLPHHEKNRLDLD